MLGFEDQSNTKKQKIQIKIDNLPFGYRSAIEGKSSVVNSLGNTQSRFMSKTKNTMTLEGTIEERENRIVQNY